MVAGDHGESLGEHGEVQHGCFIYEALLTIKRGFYRAYFDRLKVWDPSI